MQHGEHREYGKSIMQRVRTQTIVGRRRFLALTGSTVGLAILAACGDTAATETPRPAPTTVSIPPIAATAPSVTSAPAATVAPAMAAGSAAASGGTGTGIAALPTLMVEGSDYGFRTMGSIPAGTMMVHGRF